MSALEPLEAVTRVTPLGVRFWDALAQSSVAEGLVVYVRPEGSSKRQLARAGSSGVFFALDLPFLRAAERGGGDDAYWLSIVTRGFVVEVSDSFGRFLPFSFRVQLPHRGVLAADDQAASPLGPSELAPGINLYSAPSRTAVRTQATLRAELRDLALGTPAAGAVLTATLGGGQRVIGIADRQGRVALLVPYPEPLDFPPIEDPPPSPAVPVAGSSLTAYTWPVALTVQYAPTPTPYPDYPNLSDTFSQPVAQLLEDASGQPLGAQTLRFGSELIIRSSDVATGKALSVLLVKR